MKTVSLILFCVFVFARGSDDMDDDIHDPHPWSYGYQTQWQGYCTTGTQQSPINIMTRDAMEDRFEAHIRGPLVFEGYENVNLKAENNDHTLVWNKMDPPGMSRLSGGPLRGNYTFRQFHLHWLSEHALDGMKYAMEIHFVHMKEGLSTDEALSQSDGIAVIGVMCEVHAGGPESEFALKEIMADVPNLTDRGARPQYVRPVDITRLFSPNPQAYYTYHGSLTTPSCQEVVTWIVMEKPIVISDDQFKQITKVDVGTMNNYRNLQPVNRVVYRSHPVASCAHLIAPTFLATMAALLNCFSSHLTKTLKKGVCLLYSSKRKLFGTPNLKECAKMAN